MVSLGASLENVHVPGQDARSVHNDNLATSEVEAGLEIHNEPGSGRLQMEPPELVAKHVLVASYFGQDDGAGSLKEWRRIGVGWSTGWNVRESEVHVCVEARDLRWLEHGFDDDAAIVFGGVDHFCGD
ncbi:hypothetical protein EDB80DRAFT_842103 [Ilyonectria destructans]|nr:hypothetical protein EDB80DRAFT_842103 [Ilyonectria destructans]